MRDKEFEKVVEGLIEEQGAVDVGTLLRGLHEIRTILQNGQQHGEIMGNAVATSIDVADDLLNRSGWSSTTEGEPPI